MFDDETRVRDRVDRLLAERIMPAVYRQRMTAEIAYWQVDGEPVPFTQALTATYSAASPGMWWGPPWGTTWFTVRAAVPSEWGVEGCALELSVDLGFIDASPGFQAEALVYTPEGTIVKGIEPLNSWVSLPQQPGEEVELYLEAASNPDLARGGDFSPTPLGDKETAGAEPLYRLRHVDLVLRDLTVWELVQDIRTLRGLLDVLPPERPRFARVLRALADMSDAVDPDDVASTARAARDVLAPVLAQPAQESAHRVVATGHAHIDSAWLWPARETIRKCARTFSNVLSLMDEDPDFVFACSSAQQYAWVKEQYPELFERIRTRVAEGRFVPVGGMWVESDTNMPGGEAMVRQFVAGHAFFAAEFGVNPREVWLPDSFGYSAALPQIARGVGAQWFLTQKISWNDTNTMPHHSFSWEGIDGTRIFTHFPPVDTYNSDVSIGELDKAERQFADKGASSYSLLPFGYGDGGGGPTREMMAAARRAADLEGAPTVRVDAPSHFFALAEAEYAEAPVWSGELYLELHRGTYTSQARTKRGNRRSEHLLHEAELWAAVASIRAGVPYPYEALTTAWRTVLLHQFHDILPGSSIAWVHREAERNYDDVARALGGIIESSLAALTGSGGAQITVNAAPVPFGSVPALGAIEGGTTGPLVSGRVDESGYVLDNGVLRILVDRDGLVRSVVHLASGRETIPAGEAGNLLQLFRDTPNKWDAWDIDADYRRVGADLTEADSVEMNDSTIRVTRTFGSSRIVEQVSLNGSSVDFTFDVDWHERQRLLKLAFPVTVHADRFASETQFGHVYRPTHVNTSWDAARFEVCAHRWVHVAEPGFGVGVANDSTYGHDVRRIHTARGESATVIRLSLLRAPLYPDPESDQGSHRMTCSLVVGADITDVVAAGYRLNLPTRTVTGAHAPEPVAHVDDDAVVVETVKLAEDRSGDLVLRIYESTGSAREATLRTGFGWSSVLHTDLLERPVADEPLTYDEGAETVRLALRPFQILTLRFAGVSAEIPQEQR